MEILVSSIKNQILFKCYLRTLVCVVALLIFTGASAFAQTTSPPSVTPPETQTTNPNKPDDKPDFGSHENEMRAKLVIKEEKKRYDEHLERAREVSHLGSQLSETYQTKQAFSSEDGKRLERIEKLAKRIRNEAGGSDADPDLTDMPADMASAVKRVAEMAEDLRKLVEKTPRQVISAAVIEQANKLIGVIQFVRNSGRHGVS